MLMHIPPKDISPQHKIVEVVMSAFNSEISRQPLVTSNKPDKYAKLKSFGILKTLKIFESIKSNGIKIPVFRTTSITI